MSNDNITVIPAESISKEDVVPVKKKSFIQKNIITPIKNHPKLSLAIAAGVALVISAAVLGKNETDSDTELNAPIELFPSEEGVYVEDLTVA
jgi:hypothetical protein